MHVNYYNVHLYRKKVAYNNKLIIENMFREHTAHRYINRKFTVKPVYLTPMISSYKTIINSTNTKLIDYIYLNVVLITFIVFTTLYLCKYIKRKCWQNKNY